MLRGSWISLAVAAAPLELARSDEHSGSYSEPEVGFGDSKRVSGQLDTRWPLSRRGLPHVLPTDLAQWVTAGRCNIEVDALPHYDVCKRVT